MKQIIVMTAMVLLGIFLAGMIFSFKDSAKGLSNNTIDAVKRVEKAASEDWLTQ